MDQNDLKTLSAKILPVYGGKGQQSLYSKGRAKRILGELCAKEVEARREHLGGMGKKGVKPGGVREFGNWGKFESSFGRILEGHWEEVG
jgi:hypothetical protein